jgi:hypothetical protein
MDVQQAWLLSKKFKMEVTTISMFNMLNYKNQNQTLRNNGRLHSTLSCH